MITFWQHIARTSSIGYLLVITYSIFYIWIVQASRTSVGRIRIVLPSGISDLTGKLMDTITCNIEQGYQSKIKYYGISAFIKCTGNKQRFDSELNAYQILKGKTSLGLAPPVPGQTNFDRILHLVPWAGEYGCIILSQDDTAIPVDAYLARYNPKQKAKQLSKITYQIIEGMAYIHNNKITHGSIRLDSILVSQETATNLPHVIFINFELSQQALQKGRAQKNDIIYNSPESFFSELKYDLGKHDIWALGIVFYKLLTGHFPFVYNHETEQSINLTDEDRETTMICMHEDNESIDLFSPPYQNAIVIDNTRVMNIASTILVCNPAKRPSARRLQSYTPALKMDARQ